MRQPRRTTGERRWQRTANRRIWIVISMALLALLALGGTASAQSMTERVKPEPGVLIVDVGEETPASEAGLMRGDILLAIDGDMVNTAAELQHVILMQDPGDVLELTVKRGDEELRLTVTLADVDGYPLLGVAPDAPGVRGMRTQRGRFPAIRNFVHLPGMEWFKGMQAERFRSNGEGTDLNRSQQRGNRFGFAFPQGGRFDSRFFFRDLPDGALVMGVEDEGPAALAELQRGDAITAVGETNISNFEDLVEALANYSPGDEVTVTLNRDGELVAAAVTLGAHPDDGDKAYLGVSIMPLERLRMHMKEMQDQDRKERQTEHESQSSS